MAMALNLPPALPASGTPPFAAGSPAAAFSAIGAASPMTSASAVGSTVASAATPGLDHYQSALNDFGKMVGDAFKGKHFGPEDKARLDAAVAQYDQRTDVSPEQKAAMKKIAAEFKPSASNKEGRVDSFGWADFMKGVGLLLTKIPGGEKYGQALQDVAEKFRTAYSPLDGLFGKDDMRTLGGKDMAALGGQRARTEAAKPGPEVDTLLDLAKSSFRGEQFNAADFGRFFADMKIAPPVPAAPAGPPRLAGATAPPVAAGLPPNAAGTSATPVSATAFGDPAPGSFFTSKNGSVDILIDIPNAFTDAVGSLKA